MKKYYKLLPSLDMKVVGVSIQSQKYLPNESWMYWDLDSFINVGQERVINFEPKFPIFSLDKKAKITDFIYDINTGVSWLLINKRFLDIIKNFKVEEYQFYKVKVRTKTGEVLDYFMIFLNHTRDKSYISWENTRFRQTTRFMQEDIKVLNFQNFEEFDKLKRNLYETNEEIALEYLHLKNSEISSDLFRLRWVDSGFFISENLKNELESQKITGIRFVEVSVLRQPMLR